MKDFSIRIWNDKNKQMIYQSESFFYTISLCGEVFRGLENIKNKESCEILMFTGLVDCNGNNIYEGDILKIDEELFEVIYEYLDAKFILENSDGLGEFYIPEKMEVLGNIFETPELNPNI